MFPVLMNFRALRIFEILPIVVQHRLNYDIVLAKISGVLDKL